VRLPGARLVLLIVLALCSHELYAATASIGIAHAMPCCAHACDHQRAAAPCCRVERPAPEPAAPSRAAQPSPVGVSTSVPLVLDAPATPASAAAPRAVRTSDGPPLFLALCTLRR
jgi:hypothetical protein